MSPQIEYINRLEIISETAMPNGSTAYLVRRIKGRNVYIAFKIDSKRMQLLFRQ